MNRKQFSEAQRERLEQNPGIRITSPRAVVITDEFYRQIYEHWQKDKSTETIRAELRRQDLEELGEDYVNAVEWDFRRYGEHCIHGREDEERANEIALVASGSFYGRGTQLSWEPEFKEMLLETYPETSFEERLQQEGFLPDIVGRSRIGALRQLYTRRMQQRASEDDPKTQIEGKTKPKAEELGAYAYLTHPYVKSVERKNRITMAERFYDETVNMKELTIQELLRMYEIEPGVLCSPCLAQLQETHQEWEQEESACRNEMNRQVYHDTEQIIRIQRRRMKILTEYTEQLFSEIRKSGRDLRPPEKRVLCRQIAGYPTSQTHAYGYSLRLILQKTGIPKTTFYNAMNRRGYGESELKKRQQDETDLAEVIYVMEYKGFEKGIRQIYMMMPQLTGKRFAISKIRRLLRSAGIKTKIRRENPARQRVTAFHLRNTKPNILRREFRLHRPNEVRLTDVTYLDYGPENDRRRAYGSSCIDPVTGKLLALHASESNDLPLAMETLARLKEHPSMEGALLHSDQGILYLTDEFQEEVAAMGMTQSMSKRGNCWDNAPQESFFGHFKDECHYEDCEDFEQLQKMLDDYAYYYNHERHQWNRRQMTPIQYEEWMEGLSDEDFEQYLATEQTRYDSMKKKAEQQAIQRSKTLGV